MTPNGEGLLLLAKAPSPDLPARAAQGLEPRPEYAVLAEALGARIISFNDLAREGVLVRVVAKALGPLTALAVTGVLHGRSAPFVYVTGEDIGMRVGALQRLLRRRNRVVAVVHQIDTPKRRAIFRRLGHRPFRAIIVVGTEQRRIFVDELGFPGDKVVFLHTWIDEHFWRPDHSEPSDGADASAGAPMPAPGTYALAVGMESRDYPTLQHAIEGTELRVHVVGSGWSAGAGYGAASGIRAADNLTVGSGYSTPLLRDLYGGARFVVVPLNDVAYAAGVTAVLEGMAMAKAVVASDSRGVRDYLRDGRLGRVVPCGDSDALGVALLELWHAPDEASRSGAENRAWLERTATTDGYVAEVAALLLGS